MRLAPEPAEVGDPRLPGGRRSSAVGCGAARAAAPLDTEPWSAVSPGFVPGHPRRLCPGYRPVAQCLGKPGLPPRPPRPTPRSPVAADAPYTDFVPPPRGIPNNTPAEELYEATGSGRRPGQDGRSRLGRAQGSSDRIPVAERDQSPAGPGRRTARPESNRLTRETHADDR
jgi:hypothetical protein